MVIFRGVTKTFGSIVALSDASFEVGEGEFAFITGPSGAGKTTIIRLILRELSPDKGDIFLGKQKLSEIPKSQLPLYRRDVGVVFQDFKLLVHETVFENVAVALAVRGVSTQKQKEQVRQVLKDVGLSDRDDLFPAQLAGGELQRVVLARAIVGKPKVVLADEPTGNLDPDTAWQIVEILDKIASGGTTVVMATHNAAIVNKMKKHVIRLNRGKVASDEKNGKYETEK